MLVQGCQKKTVQNISTSKDLRAGGNALGERLGSLNLIIVNDTQKKAGKLTTVRKYCFMQKLLMLKGSVT